MKTQLFLTCIAASLLSVLSVPNRPPAIFLQQPFDVYYKVGETVQLQCKAEGLPAPTYTWTRNKETFDPSGNGDRMVMLPNEGTIVMNRPEDKDEGIFQCSAKNDHGISTSITINLREAMLEDFQFGEPKQVYVERGNSLKLECIPPTSIPKAEITWVLKDRYSGRIEAINFDQRITMDLEGNLYLTHVTAADEDEGKLYVCMAINYFMRKNTYDKGYLLSSYDSPGTDSNRDPHYLWTSPNEVFGLLGETIRIKCIYGGNPTPEIYWDSTTPGQIPDDRRVVSLGGQELLISQLAIEDKGSYTCYAISPTGNRLQKEIKILVKSKPYWTEDGEPMDIEKGVGETATFFCNATGDPSPDLKWFVNGVPLEDSTHPTVQSYRFLKPNRNNVTIVNLQKSDTMVLQCNASNIYGYVFADFYLNVLSQTDSLRNLIERIIPNY